jgi:hypothetical protein
MRLLYFIFEFSPQIDVRSKVTHAMRETSGKKGGSLIPTGSADELSSILTDKRF